jgi:peroxiredoxin
MLTLLIFHFQIAAQTNIQIILKTDKVIDKVDVDDISGIETHSSSYKDTLAFYFKKNNIDCYNIRYYVKDKMHREQIWLDTGNIVLTAHIANDSLTIDTVINSPIYYKVKDFFRTCSSILKTNDTTKINTFLLNAYEDNLNNPFSYLIGKTYLSRNQNSKSDLINLKSLFDRQGDNFRWFILCPIVVDRVNNILNTGKLKISGFTFWNNQNKLSKLNLSEAHYYILDFWNLGCAPCRREHKEIKLQLKKLKEKNIEVIGISTDNTDQYKSWQTYLTKNNYSWQNYLEDKNNSLTKRLAIGSYPDYVILNSDGEIISSYGSFSDISSKFKLDE